MEIDVAEIPLRAGFTGKEQDPETSLYYFGARYYDSWRGQWLSVDPLSKKYPGWSPYNYVRDNPIGFVDPNGSQQKPSWWDKIGTSSNGLKLPPLTLTKTNASNGTGKGAGPEEHLQKIAGVASSFEVIKNTAKVAGKMNTGNVAGDVMEEVTSKAEELGPTVVVISLVATYANPKLSTGLKIIEGANDLVGATGLPGFGTSLATDVIIAQDKADLQYARTHFTIGTEATSVSVPNPH